jgi:enoyl-CoA hydratase
VPLIVLKRANGVAVVTLNDPARRNALSPAMAQELIDACVAIDSDGSIGAVVVRGADGTFCSGGARSHLDDVGGDPSGDQSYLETTLVYSSFVRVGALEPPTIVALRGAAVGAGMNLALSADLRIVADDARLISGFLHQGLHPGGGHFALLGRTGGRDAAAAFALFQQELTGSVAAENGLAWRALPDDQVEAAAFELAAVAAVDPSLARVAARNFRQALGPPAISWALGLEAERGSQMWSFRRRSAAAKTGP